MSKFPDKIYLSIIPGQPGDRENDIYEEWSLAPINGVENQEYLALTWEDLQTINDLFFQVDAENSAARDDDLIEQNLPFPYGQKFYEEVLRRFREMKNK